MLRIAKVKVGSFVDGPDGPRTVVWFAGCSIRCEGCQNPHLWPQDSGIQFPPAAFAEQVVKASQGEALTITGGEPFDQPEALHQFLVAIRHHAYDRHVIIYTGYTMEQLIERWRVSWDRGGLVEDQNIGEILHMADVLVDGGYMQGLDHDHLQWRGSTNQRAIDLNQSIVAGLLALDLEAADPIITLDWDTPVLQIRDGHIILTGGLAVDLQLAELGKLEEIALCGQAKDNDA